MAVSALKIVDYHESSHLGIVPDAERKSFKEAIVTNWAGISAAVAKGSRGAEGYDFLGPFWEWREDQAETATDPLMDYITWSAREELPVPLSAWPTSNTGNERNLEFIRQTEAMTLCFLSSVTFYDHLPDSQLKSLGFDQSDNPITGQQITLLRQLFTANHLAFRTRNYGRGLGEIDAESWRKILRKSDNKQNTLIRNFALSLLRRYFEDIQLPPTAAPFLTAIKVPIDLVKQDPELMEILKLHYTEALIQAGKESLCLINRDLIRSYLQLISVTLSDHRRSQ